VDGIPHIYEAESDHSSDEYGDTYFVSPIDERLFPLILEALGHLVALGCSVEAGEVSIDTHPALPEDRERHEALKIAIGNRLRADRSRAKYKRARFGASPQTREIIVEWIDVS